MTMRDVRLKNFRAGRCPFLPADFVFVLFRDLITQFGCVKLRPINSSTVFEDRQNWRFAPHCSENVGNLYTTSAIRSAFAPIRLISIRISRIRSNRNPRRRNTPSVQVNKDEPVLAGRAPGPFGRARLRASDETRW